MQAGSADKADAFSKEAAENQIVHCLVGERTHDE